MAASCSIRRGPGRRHGHATAAQPTPHALARAKESRTQGWLRRGDRVDIDYHKEALFPTHAEGVGTACQALIRETGRKEAVIGHRRGRTALGCEGRSSRMPPAEIRRGQSNPAFPDACPRAASFLGGFVWSLRFESSIHLVFGEHGRERVVNETGTKMEADGPTSGKQGRQETSRHACQYIPLPPLVLQSSEF